MNNKVTKIETTIFCFFAPQIILFLFGFLCKILISTLSISNNVGTTLLYACAKIFDIALDIKSGIYTIILQTLFDSWAFTIQIILIVSVILFCGNYLRKILF
ncbi:MAG: hypothetical protein REH79_00435 [Spiroplasma sp.]|nr:hypothetical protein [Spiroplasma sp.]